MPKSNFRHNRGDTDLSDVFGLTVRAKKKIASLETLLERTDLAADVRIEKERALQALKVDLKNRQLELRTQKRAKKYHMVRFFERKKATRKLKQAQKAYDEAVKLEVKKDIKKARKVLKHCQVDVAYTILFPKSEKYISLYPNGPLSAEIEDPNVKKGMLITEENRNKFKKEVEQLIDDDRLHFTFEDVLAGKHINVENFKWSKEEEQTGAPAKENDIEEDDFFE